MSGLPDDLRRRLIGFEKRYYVRGEEVRESRFYDKSLEDKGYRRAALCSIQTLKGERRLGFLVFEGSGPSPVEVGFKPLLPMPMVRRMVEDAEDKATRGAAGRVWVVCGGRRIAPGEFLRILSFCKTYSNTVDKEEQ
jgi:hypothetical protein